MFAHVIPNLSRVKRTLRADIANWFLFQMTTTLSVTADIRLSCRKFLRQSERPPDGTEELYYLLFNVPPMTPLIAPANRVSSNTKDDNSGKGLLVSDRIAVGVGQPRWTERERAKATDVKPKRYSGTGMK